MDFIIGVLLVYCLFHIVFAIHRTIKERNIVNREEDSDER